MCDIFFIGDDISPVFIWKPMFLFASPEESFTWPFEYVSFAVGEIESRNYRFPHYTTTISFMKYISHAGASFFFHDDQTKAV